MIDEHEVTQRLRRTFDAVATRAIDEPAATLPFEETRTPRPRTSRLVLTGLAAGLTIALVAGGVLAATRHSVHRRVDVSSDSSTSSSVAPAVAAHPTASIELPSGTIVAGSTVTGTLLVENDTGAPIPQPKCWEGYWSVYIINDTAASGPLPRATVARRCDPSQVELAVGETRLPFTFTANYFSCANEPDSYPPTPRCLPGPDIMPPLPPGDYRVELEGTPYQGMTKPPVFTVHVVSK